MNPDINNVNINYINSNNQNSNTNTNTNTNNDSNYLIQLYGANPNSQSSMAKVSLNKIDAVSPYKWYLGKDGYPFAYIKGGRVPLHRYIWYLNTGVWTNEKTNPDGSITRLYVDHSNRDKLDATDQNLRISTPAENSYNKTSSNRLIDPVTSKPLHHIKLTKSGYSVSLTKDGKTNKISKIATLEEAKSIYNMMATELFGEFAVLYE
jgi:hypothetical protein